MSELVNGWARRRDRVVRAAVDDGLISEAQSLAAFVDLRGIEQTASAVHDAWPGHLDVRHAFAAKANSLVPVLRSLRGHGFGCEVASAGEFAQALAAGFKPSDLVFDSPAKTSAELKAALSSGVAVNADNFQELDRIDAILARHRDVPVPPIGVRVNPQVGLGGIEAMSTAGDHSKFGIALKDPGNRRRLLDAYLSRPWLSWVHVHVGSQGSPLKLIGEGVAAVVEFALEVNRHARRRQVVGIDIGGGVSIDFEGADPPDFAGHAEAVLAAAPALARGEFTILTEFGRSVMAQNGFMAAKVEYTKSAGGRRVAITHLGAHVTTRTAFAPQSWPLRVLAYDCSGSPKPGAATVQDIAGPCCFAGDLVASARPLPLLDPGDIVVAPDTGAYYFSTPFHYNSLPAPAVYAFDAADEADKVQFTLVRAPESLADIATIGAIAPV